MTSEQNKILTIADHLADRVKDSKRPYLQLKWIVKNCDWQYRASKSELLEAYFAAINILKQKRVENPKRNSLTSLSKEQRVLMRKRAKNFASLVGKFLNTQVEVTRDPIKTDRDGETYIQVAIKRKASTSYFYPSFDDLSKWAELDESNQATYAYKFAQQLKPPGAFIDDHIETIKAKLESSL